MTVPGDYPSHVLTMGSGMSISVSPFFDLWDLPSLLQASRVSHGKTGLKNPVIGVPET